MKLTIITCNDCAAGISNDDWTHLDYHYDQDESDMVMATIQANLENFGWLTLVEHREESSGCFHCQICEEISFDNGNVWECEQ